MAASAWRIEDARCSSLSPPRINVRLRLQDQIIGVEPVRPFALDTLDLRESQARLDRADNGQRELVLKRENIVELTVVTLGPNVRSDCGVDELPGYAHAIASLAHAAFEHITHAQLAADLLHVDCLALVGECCVARDDEEPSDARETSDDVLNHAVAEIILFRIAAHV